MACTRYIVTVTRGNENGFVSYIDCNFQVVNTTLRPGSSSVIFAEQVLASNSVTNVVGQSDPTPPPPPSPPPSFPGSTRLVPVILGRVATDNPADACRQFNDGTAIRDTYYIDRSSIRTANAIYSRPEGGETVSGGIYTDGNSYVIVAGRAIRSRGTCPSIAPPPPDPRPSLTEITLCVGIGSNATSESLCESCLDSNTSFRRRYYINSTTFSRATEIYADSLGNSRVSGASFIDPTTSTFREVDSSGNLGTPILCGASLQATYFVIQSCTDSNVRFSTLRPPTAERERVVYRGSKYVYTGEQGGRIVGNSAVPPGDIEGDGGVGCEAEGTEIQYAPLRSCSNNSRIVYSTRLPAYANEQVIINGETFYYSGPATSRRPPTGSTIVDRGIESTGRTRCNRETPPPPPPPPPPGGGSPPPPPPPPPPTEVVCVFREVIRPSLASVFDSRYAGEQLSTSDLIEGEILLNGNPIGNGQASATLKIGERYVVEFRKPSHPYFSFSDGTPSRYVIESAGLGTTLVESIFTPTFVADTGRVTITTSYDPILGGADQNADIFITGKGKVGKGSATVELEPGDYTVYFGDIYVAGMVFTTPAKRVIKVEVGKNTRTNGNFVGVPLPSGYWLKQLDSIEKTQLNTVTTKGMFSNNIGNLVTFYSSSISDSIDNHYTHVYHEPINSITSSIQFSLSYGHYNGSGSNDEGGQISDTPTKAIYGQYRNIILGTANGKFNLAGQDTDDIYVLSFQKDRRDTRADYKALEINLAHLSGSEFINGEGFMAAHTGSNVKLGGEGKVLRLISDYAINTNPQRTVPSAPIEYNIVSGSIEDGVYNQSSPHYYGKLYPSIGVALLDPSKLDVSASFGTVTSREIDGKNQLKLFTAISGAAQYTDASGDYLGMKARATKEELVYHYFINVRGKEFVLSNNPSYYDQETGLILEDFRDDPKCYITTIGLYDVNRNLIAVAKPSVPEFNSFTDEVMFNVKLKF